ncbi:MAG: response regulator [Clostridia bacterium]
MGVQKRMLIVDDVEINRAILQELFSDEYDILDASNGAEAMLILENSFDDISVILLDVVMPIMDGFSTLSEMQSWGYLGKIPVIAMTAGDGTTHDVSIVDMGAEDIISKPFIAALVKRRVHNVVDAYEYRKLKNAGVLDNK